MSNVRSVINMINKVGSTAVAKQKPTNLQSGALYILPGVGTFDEGMKGLKTTGWGSALKDIHEADKSKILGLCLGMQLLSEGSEEGVEEGLAIIPGNFIKFAEKNNQTEFKVPHMGWNEVDFNERILKFLPAVPQRNRFYFVHSYHYTHRNQDHVVGTTTYHHKFASVIENKNALGLQFHPEKSHRFGAEIFSSLLAVKNA